VINSRKRLMVRLVNHKLKTICDSPQEKGVLGIIHTFEKNGVKVRECFTSCTDIMETHMSLKMTSLNRAGHVFSVDTYIS
jgi:hypothetical protein